MKNMKVFPAVLSMLFALSLRAEVTPTFTGWLTTEDQLIWESVQLELLSDFHGMLGGKAGLNDSPDGPAYFTKNSGSVTTLQFHRQDGNSIKGVIVQFTQVDGDVYGKVLSARYKAGTAGETDISDGTKYDVATSSSAYYYGVHDLYATVNTLTTYAADTSAASWSQIDNWSPSAFVPGPWSAAVLNLGGASFDFDVEGLTARSVAITSAGALTLTASKVPSGVPLYDLSGATGKTVLDFDPGASTVLAGSATYAGIASTEAAYVIASGKRLYVSDPTAAGTMKITQEGVLGYTGTFDIGANPNPQKGEGLEYAGTHTLNSGIEACPKPVYFSGTTTVPHDKHFVRSTTSDLRIVGGETLIAGKALLSHGSGGYAGANIKVSGGVLKGDPNAADPYVYWGGYSGTINLAVNGTGRWEAAIKPYGKNSSIGKYAVTITVSEKGVFAPSALAFNDGSDTAASGARLVMNGGTFEMPASVPYWLPEEVASGMAVNVISADTAMAAPLTVAAGATLVVRAGMVGAKLTLTSISGTGDVIVEKAVLDLSDADYSTFGGTITTVGGGKLLPEGIGEGLATVNVDGTESGAKWTDLPWKGFFRAPVDPSKWLTGEIQAGFAGNGRVEIGEIDDGVLAKSVTVPSTVTVSVGGGRVIPGTIVNDGMIEYAGTQSFTEARTGLGGAVTLAGEHSFVLGKDKADCKPVINGIVFAGETVFTNTVATGFVQCYTDSKSPLTVTDGVVDLGNLMVCIAHEDASRLWTADVSGDAIVRGGFLRWGWYHWAMCDIALGGTSRLETPMGPLCGGTAHADAYMRVTVGGSAVFAPAWLKTVKKYAEIGDYESDNRANDLEVVLGRGQAADVEPTFELPETVPSWVGVRAVAEGARLAVPAGRSAVFNGTAVTEGDAKLTLAGAGRLDAQSVGSFADAAVRLDGATVEIGEHPLACASFEYVSGRFDLIGRMHGPRMLVRSTTPMSPEILSLLPSIKDRKYALSDDGMELSLCKCNGVVIFFR